MRDSRWTWHGGGIAAARAHFDEGPDAWLDLSTGINPHAWPGADAISIDWRSLPDEHGLRGLEQAAAAHFGCDAGHVCAVPGTEVGLRLAGALLPRPVFHLVPTYRTHGEMVAESLPLPIEEVAAADGATLVLANPNNPDGRLLGRDALIDLLARRRRTGWLVLDEAFADCHPELSLASEINDRRRLLIFRSFGKFFGLAGLRLGFVLGPRDVIGQLRQRLGAWPVSAAAIAIGTAAYRDADWTCRMRTRLVREAEALDAGLLGLGYTAVGGCPLFRLIECSAAHPLFERLAGRSILTRPFDAQPGWLRIGLPGSDEGLARLLAAITGRG